MTLIVDASIVVKWLYDEVDSELARPIADRADLAAPEFLLLECHHVLWKRYRRGETSWAAVIETQRGLSRTIGLFVPDQLLRADAVHLSLAHTLAIYDCLYIALARRENAPLVTADERQFSVARQVGVDVRML